MKTTPRLFCFAQLLIVSVFMSPGVRAQGRGAFVAGINYPAGPPTVGSNTNFYFGGVSPVEIHSGDFNGDGKLDVVVAASCAAAGNGSSGIPGCPASGSAVVVYLSNGDGTFQPPILSGEIPPEFRSLVVGDFNGDNKLDVAAAADCLSTQDCSAGTVSVLLGNGDGTFTQSSQYALNGIVSQANTLAVGDFNHDGKLDLAAGITCYNIPVNGCSVGAVAIFPGNGNGTLAAPGVYTTVGNSALYPVVGDFNGDGNLDVIAGSPTGPSLSELLGKGDGTFVSSPNGDGTFRAPVTTLTFSGLSALASADFNADGKLDLAISTGAAAVQILSGNGDGTFQSPVTVSGNLGNSLTNGALVIVADLNHDGMPDLMVSGTLVGNNGVQLFLNDGTGNFVSGPAYGLGGWENAPFVAQDFNGDGNADIVMASTCSEDPAINDHCPEGTLSVLLGNADGTMQGAKILNQSSAFTQTYSIITADINGDGIPDLIETSQIFSNQNSSQGGVIVYLGTGNGNYGPPTSYPTGSPVSLWVAAGDFNGDGKIDVAVANDCLDSNCTQGGVAILLGNGDGTFQAPAVYGSGAQYSFALATGDFNRDGKLDVAVMNQSASISILLGNGDGTLQPAVVTDTSASGTSNYSIAAGDFNNDGRTDVALVSQDFTTGSGLISVYLSNGNGSLVQTGASYSSGGTAFSGTGMSLAVADVNGDGKLDIVAANGCELLDSNCGYGSLSVLLGNGDGTFQGGSLLKVPDGHFVSLLLADINGDGILDAIAANLTGVAVFPGNPDGSFQAPTVYAGVTAGGQNISLALADLNIIQPGLLNNLIAILVNKAGTYLVTNSSGNQLSTSQAVTLTTTVSASYLKDITPTGSISYYDGATNLGSAALVGGVASFNIASGLSKGEHSIKAYYSGDSNFNAHIGTPTILLVREPASIAATGGTPQSAQVNTAFARRLVATVVDSFGNPVPGVTVTFNAPASGASGTFAGGVNTAKTNSSGVATAPVFTANTIAGTYAVTATTASFTTSPPFSLTNKAGAPTSITATGGTPQSAKVNTAFAKRLMASVLDSFGNPAPGVTVTFNAPASGASGTFAGGVNTAKTNSSGVASAPVFTANTTAGTYTIIATTGSLSTSPAFSLTNKAGAPASITATGGTPQSAKINTAFARRLAATVVDSFGNPVQGVTVTFNVPSSGANGTFAGGVNTAKTNSSGVATAPAFTANSTVGRYTVTATTETFTTNPGFALRNTAN